MTAISPYAPIRRQSSTLSNASSASGGGGRMVRRSSSAINAATTAWILIRVWRRIRGNADGNSNGRSSINEYLNYISYVVYSSLMIDGTNSNTHHIHSGDSSSGAQLSCTVKTRKITKILHWLVRIVGGDQSRIGRIITNITGFVREAILRSIGAANLLLTGSTPTLLLPSKVDTNNIENNHQHENCIQLSKTATSSEISIESIKQDSQHIHQVLHYWFGQASPDGAQKRLWMIASSSAELLSQVDDDISKKFRSLILDLSSNWLSGSDDNTDMLSRWTESTEIHGWQGKLAAIIALDQMSRHIHRRDKNHDGDNSIHHIPKQQQLDSIAYNISKKLQDEHQNEISTGMIPIGMRIFGIMPLRHASTIQDVGIVQQDVEASATLHEEMDGMIRRFRKATNRRMAALQDEARREGKLGLLSSAGDANLLNGDDGKMNNQQFSDEMILECFPFKSDMSKAHEHTVIKAIGNFLCKMNILQVSDARSKSSKKANHSSNGKKKAMELSNLEANPSADHVPTAIVSLSGGVDSMAIASALAYIRDTEATRRNAQPENVLCIIAIHIDYANRPESGAEAAYVGRFCEEIGAKFICRKIDEVTRGVTARDDYERIAREIRFDLYRECCTEAKSSGTNANGIGIMLGHHRGDLRENVLSNAHKGCGPLDLSGMTEVSKNDGVNLFRPLLSLEKTYIYDYSHAYGVPYFKDTTPHWSTRGKLRNRLLPLLEEIYGEGSMNNLSSLAEESDDARALRQQTVMGPFMKQVKHYPMGITFETSSWKGCGLFFWKFVLRQILHSAGLGMFSDKSVECFLERVRVDNVREGWLQCRKDYAVFLQKDGRVFVFYPNSFPFGNGRKKCQYDIHSNFLGYGPENSMQVGPWMIKSLIIEAASEKEANSMLKTKALKSMEDLMAGEVEYYMKVPIMSESSLPCPLIRVAGFTKPTRPQAWKGFDLKVESTLPLLGVDHSMPDEAIISGHDQYEKTWALVKVQLLLETKQEGT